MDQRRHVRRHEPVDRLAASDAVADLPRRHGHGLDVEELDPLRAGEPAENLVEPLARSFGAAVAETDHHDLWQRARLTAALTSQSLANLTANADNVERWLDARCPEGVRVERVLASVEDLQP